MTESTNNVEIKGLISYENIGKRSTFSLFL